MEGVHHRDRVGEFLRSGGFVVGQASSMATIFARSLNPVVWALNQGLNACFERPSTTASSLDAPVRVLVGVKSTITVT